MYNNVQDVACQTAEDVCLPESQLFSIFFYEFASSSYYDACGMLLMQSNKARFVNC